MKLLITINNVSVDKLFTPFNIPQDSFNFPDIFLLLTINDLKKSKNGHFEVHVNLKKKSELESLEVRR